MLTRKIFSLLIIFLSAYHSQAIEVAKKAQVLFKEALELNAVGDYPTAISKYIEAFNEDSNIAGLNDEGIFQNAIKHFEKLLQTNPQDHEILMWLGTIHSLNGDNQAAIKYYQKVIDISPTSPQSKEADKEILRIEAEIREKQKNEIVEKQKESQKMQETEILRENLKREMEQEYAAKLEAMRSEIDELKAQIQKLQEESQSARQKNEQLTQEHEALQETNAHHRRMYLLYKYKKK